MGDEALGEMRGIRDAFGEFLLKLGQENPDVVVLTADLAESTRTAWFGRQFPERFFNMGVSEQDMMVTAAGLATTGKIPFVSTFAIFETGRAWEQIRQSICYTRLNVKLVASHAGITVGADGASHHCTEDIALMRVLPNMIVIVPADAVEMEKVLEAILSYNGPVYVRGSREKFPVLFDEDYRFEIGKGHILREGDKATVIAAGIMVSKALEAATELEREGIGIRVVNMSTIKPIDQKLILESAQKTGAVVTAEEHSIIGGLGSAVAEVLGENYPVPMKRIGVRDQFGMSGKANELLEKYGLTATEIVKAVKEVVNRKDNGGR